LVNSVADDDTLTTCFSGQKKNESEFTIHVQFSRETGIGTKNAKHADDSILIVQLFFISHQYHLM